MLRMTLKSDSARVNLRIDHDNKTVGIFGLQSKEPRQGHATALMRLVVEQVDKLGYDAYLTARPYGPVPIKLDDLVRFYERFGFTPMGGISRRQKGMWRSRK